MRLRILLFTFLLYFCIANTVNAQNLGDAEHVNLHAVVNQLNEECPISLGSGGEIVSLDIDNDDLVFDIVINEDMAGENWMADPGLTDRLLSVFRRPIAIIKYLEELTVENNLNLKFILTSDISGQQLESVLTVDEMREILSQDNTSNDETLLETMIESNRKVLPLAAAPGMTVTEMLLTSAELKVITILDPEVVNAALIIGSGQAIKQNMLNMLNQDLDPSVSLLASLCAKTGRSFVYRYELEGDPSQAVEVMMTAAELREAVPAQYMAL